MTNSTLSASANPRSPRFKLSPRLLNLSSIILLLLLMLLSLSIGVADFSWRDFWLGVMALSKNALATVFPMLATGEGASSATTGMSDAQLLWVSRIPRTLAIVLTGASLSVAGMIMQVVLKNRFVEPSMVGATQSAGLGLLVISLYLPSSSLFSKMLVATLFAIVSIIVFMRLIKPLPPSDYLMLPLVGIVFGGIIEAITVFLAYQTESLQMLSVWQFGDFSAVLAGRYELLYITAGLAVIAYVLADKLTIVGLGDAIATNLGINQDLMIWFVVITVAMISAVVVVTVGAIPFVGLIVPNIISRMMGDRLRRCLPAVALMGASFVLLCDIIGRSIIYPFEVPVATIFGVVGAGIFLWLLMRKPKAS